MKHIIALALVITFLHTAPAEALKCESKSLNRTNLDDYAMIIKGEVLPFDESLEDMDMLAVVPTQFRVTKSWRGAYAGDEVTIWYQVLGGDGLPYQLGKEYIVYGKQVADGKIATNGCDFFDVPGIYNSQEQALDVMVGPATGRGEPAELKPDGLKE